MASPLINRQWILVKRPQGQVVRSDFDVREEPVRQLQDGEILIKNTFLSFDPAQRGWMDDAPSYMPPIPLGGVVRAGAIGEVIESKNPNYSVGDKVSGIFGWQEYAIAGGSTSPKKIPEGVPATAFMNGAGPVGLTAYFGMLQVGKVKKGDVVVVSGAAGATGSLAGQIAKIQGCRVIGIAGGQEKCKWIKEIGFDEAIDYKSEDVSKRLGELAPTGINVFFDNVAGSILEAAISNMADFGVIVQCGGISAYNETERAGPRNYLNVIKKRLTIQGFILFDFAKEFEGAVKELIQWISEGKLKTKEDIQEGFENIPETFFRLFKGDNMGKQLLKL